MNLRFTSFRKLALGRKSALSFILFSILIFPVVLFTSNSRLIVRAEEPITFPNPAPSSPQNLQVFVNNNMVNISWDIVNPTSPLIVDYRIEYRAQGESTWHLHDDGVSTNTFFTTTLQAGTPQQSLEARVLSIGADGQISAPSNIVPFTISPSPSTPQNLQILVNNKVVNVSWDINNATNPLIVDYRIEYRTQGESIWHLSDDGVSANTSLVVNLPGGIPQMALEARVLSIGADGQLSAPSNVVPYTIGPIANTKPNPPVAFGVIVSSGNIFGIWQPTAQPSDITVVDYQVEWSVQGSEVWNTFTDGVTTNNFINVFTNTTGSPAINLVGRVRAVASNGEISEPSNIYNFIIGHN